MGSYMHVLGAKTIDIEPYFPTDVGGGGKAGATIKSRLLDTIGGGAICEDIQTNSR